MHDFGERGGCAEARGGGDGARELGELLLGARLEEPEGELGEGDVVGRGDLGEGTGGGGDFGEEGGGIGRGAGCCRGGSWGGGKLCGRGGMREGLWGPMRRGLGRRGGGVRGTLPALACGGDPRTVGGTGRWGRREGLGLEGDGRGGGHDWF